MHLRDVRLHWSLLLVPFGAAALAVGCLPAPTHPDIRVPSFTAPATSRRSANPASLGGLLGGALPDSLVWVRVLAPQPTGSQTFHVVAASGGGFTFGRVHLVIPPGALAGDADVTIAVPDSGTVGCDLQISPPGLDHFARPVTLTFDCTRTTLSQLLGHLVGPLGRPSARADGGLLGRSGLGVYWEGPDGWVLVGNTLDVRLVLLSAQLQHFSRYRAGW